MNSLSQTIEYFIFIFIELSLLFIGISALISVLLVYIPKDKLSKWLSYKGLTGNFLATLVGALTPFCACSTIPITLGLLNAGTPFGSVISFIISSPILNPLIIGMIVTLFGIKAAIIYLSVTMLAAILFGALLGKLGVERYVKNVRIKSNLINEIPNIKKEKFSTNLKIAFNDSIKNFRKVLPFMFIGVAAGAAIYGYLPKEFIIQVAGPDNPFSIPFAALIGIPLYIRAETALPIGLALANKGVSLGTVIALIIGGAGMAIPEMSMLAGIFKKRLVGMIIIIVFSTAVLSGFIFNSII